jgi:hypothetical protein
MMEFEKDIEAYQINIEHFKSLEFHAHTLKTILDESVEIRLSLQVLPVWIPPSAILARAEQLSENQKEAKLVEASSVLRCTKWSSTTVL